MATLADIMTPDPFTAAPDASIRDVAEAMVRGRFGSALVVDGTMLLGIFTERDVLRATAAAADPATTPVSDWMTEDPVTGTAKQSAAEATELMLSGGFRHLPVLNGAELVGVVSVRDLLSLRIGSR